MMLPENKNFFGFVANEFIRFLNEVAIERSTFSLFRRTPPILSWAEENSDAALFCEVRLPELKEESPGTFVGQIDPDRVLIYRNPTPFRLALPIRLGNMSPPDALKVLDKWYGFFFDNRTIEPFVPGFLETFAPEIFTKLKGARAEIKIARPDASETNPVLIHFTYAHLYHSGNALREELKTKHRNLDLRELPERRNT